MVVSVNMRVGGLGIFAVTHILPVWLLGVEASRLTRGTAVQRDLFDDGTRQGILDQTIDAISGQFGADVIRRGSL